MGNSAVGVVIVVMMNLLMMLVSSASSNLAETTGTTLYNCSGTILSTYSPNGDCKAMMTNQQLSDNLPNSVSPVSTSSGLGFVDYITTAGNWIKNTFKGIVSFLVGPYTIIAGIPGLPEGVGSLLGLAWYAISLFVIAAFIMGKE